MNKSKYLCACNGLPCDGVCAGSHLHRVRDWTKPKDTCPSAHVKKDKK